MFGERKKVDEDEVMTLKKAKECLRIRNKTYILKFGMV
jgi:hypothetical protein